MHQKMQQKKQQIFDESNASFMNILNVIKAKTSWKVFYLTSYFAINKTRYETGSSASYGVHLFRFPHFLRNRLYQGGLRCQKMLRNKLSGEGSGDTDGLIFW